MDKYSRIVTQNIHTRTLQIGDTTYTGETIQTPRHDIGYHFELQDDEEVYEEGIEWKFEDFYFLVLGLGCWEVISGK